MICFEEMWKKLEKYLKVDRALEQGYSNGKYTKVLASYAKEVVGIDASEDFFAIAKNNLKDYQNVDLQVMDAKKMNFPDKSFDVLLNTSFHEFDLSHGIYHVDLELKRKILEEMIRVSSTIIFVEPTEEAVTNALFKVFDPSENHSDRIYQSNQLIREFMKENNYELVESGFTYNDDHFNTLSELEEEMLNWWADIKVPDNEEDKRHMIKEIDTILEKVDMLKDLHVIEEIRFQVFQLKGE